MTSSETSKVIRLLLVEDEELVRNLLTEMLTAQGITVIAVANAQEALALAPARSPDLVLSDTHMPGMDGVELLTRFSEDPELAAVPFFLMSGSPEEEQRALAAGALRFFHKPITDGAHLARTLREAGGMPPA